MMTIDDVIERFDGSLAYSTNSKEICQYIADLLKELRERREAPEIVRCDECTHYIPISSSWGKCGVHSSPTEKYRTCQSCDYCSWAEKREEESKWVKNPLLTL